MTTFRLGYALGLIVGEGCFTGDGEDKWLAVKLHANDPLPIEALRCAFGGRVYGPFFHGGRHYRVWMLRGVELRRAVPILEKHLPQSRKRDQFIAWRDGVRYEDPAELGLAENVARGTQEEQTDLPLTYREEPNAGG